MPNPPLQVRAGSNRGTRPQISPDVNFIGQPAFKAKAGDTVIFQNSPVIPGESNPRTVGLNPVLISGMVYNLTGGTVEFEYILIDDKGNEFNLMIGTPLSVLNGGALPIETVYGVIDKYVGFLCLPVGWSVILRMVSGSPTAGRGLVIWPWAHDVTDDIVPIVAPITTTISEFGPPKGKGWQLQGRETYSGIIHSGIQGLSVQIVSAGIKQLAYLNFDSVTRNVKEEYLHLAGEDIKISSGIVVTPRNDHASGVETGFIVMSGLQENFILCYPDTIKVRANENQTTAPLYMVANFAEFDLPRDLG